ncbi:hypothetical protein [Rubellicoccus peritrichatus]|uniref:Uncharacterized protein n=1 Tax=Rubellicoccus peritrichatus TaxID=3080537 RepID=A0AAQ3LC31_9BACT|nr:hypothetical protein [Puniceicoccus sp. CR14]WOO42582.1 hypothetical protein RZN69_05725 [Puniceicoccus sp. CR14]
MITKTGRIIISITVLFTLLLCAACESENIKMDSERIDPILKKHFESDFDKAGLNEVSPETYLKLRDNTELLKYELPNDPSIADDFVYTIYKDLESGDYWIVKRGGFAGVTIVYASTTTKP